MNTYGGSTDAKSKKYISFPNWAKKYKLFKGFRFYPRIPGYSGSNNNSLPFRVGLWQDPGLKFMGVPGAQGPKGDKGVAGRTITGPKGARGAQGPRGNQGKSIQGPRGITGQTGKKGEAGTGLQQKQFQFGGRYIAGDYVFARSNANPDWTSKPTWKDFRQNLLDQGVGLRNASGDSDTLSIDITTHKHLYEVVQNRVTYTWANIARGYVWPISSGGITTNVYIFQSAYNSPNFSQWKKMFLDKEATSMWIAKGNFSAYNEPRNDSDNWTEFKAPRGATGKTGAVGKKGEEGDKGDKGIKGIQGNQGDKGNTGDKGDEGDQGPQGDQGNQGDKGDKGVRGLTGLQGPKGDKGERGEGADVKQYILVNEGIPDMGIRPNECERYGNTLGAPFGVVNDTNAPSGCFASDPGDGSAQMNYNKAKTTQPCGVRYGNGRARCLHEMPFSLVKSYP